mmetsp:Transcript_10448/g.28560  ORF Transcript_10448/g.28560 Transcript_10448/m.28560 type:complete len:216 (-) Transcript_10448:528-1175(-)
MGMKSLVARSAISMMSPFSMNTLRSARTSTTGGSSCVVPSKYMRLCSSICLHPLYRASMTSVDVTSFSLKNCLTTPLRMTSAFSDSSLRWSSELSWRHTSRNLRASSLAQTRRARFSSQNRRQTPSTLVRYTRTSSRRYCGSKQRKGFPGLSRMTCTCALMTRVSATVKPSSTLDSSMNFFQPQSCSFLQKRCSVSEYLDFLGSLLTTAMVNWAK